MALFTIENVNYKNIIRYPNIEIPEGGATFICGESGSGKSTLLKLLNGVISPTDGKINYLDKNIEDYDPITLRREVLLISQSVYLFDMSIKDNFNEYYAYRDLENISEEEMKNYLDICSVHLPLDSMCSVMSGGERQRVFNAINLSFQSKVLMLDEPTSALDYKNANALLENVKSFCKRKEKTLLVVSHDRAIANKFADNIINL
ncbi:ABC transporter ATP-binding protein [Lachnoclostridium phytofermentans]|uniref:ABC transporter related n=1 Tax=Lachnoclostridium phytofermentans (strain ATCC 700394 / DSM 18823 / ISDg) TaxID=357809 RepID=A9KMM9_LACP7|nr:ABC transporter ATP-binding protein [Lachnoclostridium phytofermentans]ABX41474.1 ABC transporter related [Lachnoclostridium phytofermentans ISDg]